MSATLMARVIANRVWSRILGKGLSEHPNQLGVSSKPPSHPALLDYLQIGSSKKVIRRCVPSSHPDFTDLPAQRPSSGSRKAKGHRS